ncbi:MAG: bifunctional 23S rRNA (guanine(2069)-N(7))-methyltransferase RlmK/23S rRNA (guanine(2445)-N(2))-methyltransferase RlmL [Desulfuromonadales bacterium]
MLLDFFATAPKGMEQLLADELRALGATAVDAGRGGVAFRGPLATGYRACLWSRTASRVLLPLARFKAPTPEALYAGINEMPWEEHLAPEGTLTVDFTLAQSQITHSHFAALKVKDAVVDRFRDRFGVRPSIDRARPDLRLNVYLYRDSARVGLDLSGESLHRRGYREEGAAAPLKENLAAAILLLAGWPELARAGAPFVDPLCGSGTLPIEAALLAGDVAPGLLRPHFGFLGWKGHDGAAWDALLADARQRAAEGKRRLPAIIGFDAEASAVRAALANIERAGLHGLVHAEKRELSAAEAPRGAAGGLLAANPPYGERLGEEKALVSLYARLGEALQTRFAGWRAAVFTGNERLGMRLGLAPARTDILFNGPIECRLLHFAAAEHPGATAFSAGGEMFANRLRKNLKNLRRWAQREGVDCYRVYDADLPEYAVAVDFYQGDGRWAHVQEYAAPNTIDAQKAEARLREALAVIPAVLEIPPAHVFFKVRQRQRGKAQYEKQQEAGEFHEVREGGRRLLVNFTDYLDTGLFLDHRPVRRMIGELAAGKSFLNLFAYTGAATVHAAAGGARQTTTVDMSRTYLDWAKRNLALNGYAARQHELIQADCLTWLAEEARRGRRQWDLIFLDPPTFSASKRMTQAFDVQRDHVTLIRQAVSLLAAGGVLFFSTNFRKFRLDAAALADLRVTELTGATIPADFARDPKIHQVWRIAKN